MGLEGETRVRSGDTGVLRSFEGSKGCGVGLDVDQYYERTQEKEERKRSTSPL